MPFLTAAALAVSAASLGAGLYEKSKGDEQSRSGIYQQQLGYGLQAQAASQMHNISVAQAAASVGFAQQNQGINVQAAQQSAAAAAQSGQINQQIIQYNQQIQANQQQAMELDARRQQLQMIRTQQQARAQALTVATAQGARLGSGLQGGYGQISGQTNTNLLGVQQNLQFGENIAAANRGISQQNLAMQQLNTLYAQQRADTQTQLSNLIYQNAASNADFQTQQANAQQLMSQGQGQVNMASGTIATGNMQSQLGTQLIGASSQIFSAGMSLQQQLPTFQNWFSSISGPGSMGIYSPETVTGRYSGPI